MSSLEADFAEIAQSTRELSLDSVPASSDEPHHDMEVVANPHQISASQLHEEAKKKSLAAIQANTKLDQIAKNAPDRHLAETGAEDLTLILAEETAAQNEFDQLFAEYNTYDNPIVLKSCIRLLESWIGLYKLKPMDELLEKIEKYAEEIYNNDKNDTIYVKIVQLKAFMKFKQHKFQDAMNLFEQFKVMTGPSAELLENMGHTYNALGRDTDAVKCFKDAISIQNNKIESIKKQVREVIQLDRDEQRRTYMERNNGQEPPELTPEELAARVADEDQIEKMTTEAVSLDMGGLLLGLATSLKRQGEYKPALMYLDKALQLYKKRFNNQDHSLIAKTLTSVSDTCMRMKNIKAGLDAAKEAVRIFKVTCGISPLTANALQALGDCYVVVADDVLNGLDVEQVKTMNQAARMELVAKNWFYVVQGVLAYDEAFQLHCSFDTPDYNQIIRLIQSILDTKTKLLDKPFPTPTDQPLSLASAMSPYLGSLKTCLQTITARGDDNTDEAGVLYKSFGELSLLAGDYKNGLELLFKAKQYFRTVTNFDCTGLIETCNGLIGAGIHCCERDNISLDGVDYTI
jgi:tetratricopeptide (TPR) repeat protein